MSELRKTIKTKLKNYLDEDLSFDNFLDWLIAKTWDIHKYSDLEDAEKLSNKIDTIYIEYSENHLTKDEFKNELEKLI